MHASVDRTSVKVLVRDFVTSGLKEKEALVERIAQEVVGRHRGAGVEFSVEESYRNMRGSARALPPLSSTEPQRDSSPGPRTDRRTRPIRLGGTDASRLSFMGTADPQPVRAGEPQLSLAPGVECRHRTVDKAVEV
jgi:tripeptide aminopeptidase